MEETEEKPEEAEEFLELMTSCRIVSQACGNTAPLISSVPSGFFLRFLRVSGSLVLTFKFQILNFKFKIFAFTFFSKHSTPHTASPLLEHRSRPPHPVRP